MACADEGDPPRTLGSGRRRAADAVDRQLTRLHPDQDGVAQGGRPAGVSPAAHRNLHTVGGTPADADGRHPCRGFGGVTGTHGPDGLCRSGIADEVIDAGDAGRRVHQPCPPRRDQVLDLEFPLAPPQAPGVR